MSRVVVVVVDGSVDDTCHTSSEQAVTCHGDGDGYADSGMWPTTLSATATCCIMRPGWVIKVSHACKWE